MKLGVVVTDQSNGGYAIDIIRAAHERHWDVRCFLTDSGVRLLAQPQFLDLVNDGAARVAVCELSIERYGEGDPALAEPPEAVVVGGQYQDAELVNISDTVLVF